jgi:DNA excision repair protein ERCC-5
LLRFQELLSYFGIPFVDAPGEAEAQCVHLESCGLTNGTISDDSDVWAFGGRIVYRNVFDRKKSTLEYRMDSVNETFGLDRLHFVALASILGCDYSPGIVNVGVVAALEIISTFVADKNGLKSEKKLTEKLAKFR